MMPPKKFHFSKTFQNEVLASCEDEEQKQSLKDAFDQGRAQDVELFLVIGKAEMIPVLSENMTATQMLEKIEAGGLEEVAKDVWAFSKKIQKDPKSYDAGFRGEHCKVGEMAGALSLETKSPGNYISGIKEFLEFLSDREIKRDLYEKMESELPEQTVEP